MTTPKREVRGKQRRDMSKVSDGYHTFEELYAHRHWLFIALCRHRQDVWKSKRHSDGSMFKGMFIAGIGTKNGKQITYHLPLKLWREVRGETLDFAPPFDGHTSQNVVHRLKSLSGTPKKRV
jgi:hypothetical protein